MRGCIGCPDGDFGCVRISGSDSCMKIGEVGNGYWLGIAALPVGHGNFTVQEVVWEKPIRDRVTAEVGRRIRPYVREMIAQYEMDGPISGDYRIGAVSEKYRNLARSYGHQGNKKSLALLVNAVKKGRAPKWLLRWAHNKRMEKVGLKYKLKKKSKGFFGKLWSGVKKVAKKAGRWIKKTVKKISKWKIVRTIVKGVKKVGKFLGKVYKHPLFASVLKGVSSIIPGLSPVVSKAYDLSKKALKWVDKIHKGAKGAIHAAGRVVKLAKTGHKKAQQLVKRLRKASKLVKKAKHTREVWRATKKAGGLPIKRKLPPHLRSMLCK